MPEYHDPYLHTVKRTLDDKQSKKRKKQFKESNIKQNQQSFLKQNIDLDDYLPESLRNIIGPLLFIMLPYITGVMFLFFIIAQANIETYNKIDANSFILAWSIGYEIIALCLLLIIINSAITFRSKRRLLK